MEYDNVSGNNGEPWKLFCKIGYPSNSMFVHAPRSPSCHTFIEFYDASKPIRKLCSPAQKNINEQILGGSTQQALFTSTHSRAKISLIRAVHLVKENEDEEFVDGAYSFHNRECVYFVFDELRDSIAIFPTNLGIPFCERKSSKGNGRNYTRQLRKNQEVFF